MPTYTDATHFAQSWGLLALVVLFALAVAYALWPNNRSKFEKASRAPLEEDEDVRT